MTNRNIPMSFSCPPEIADYLDNLQNRSAFIVKAIKAYQEDMLGDEELAFKIKHDIDTIDEDIEKKKQLKNRKLKQFEKRVGCTLDDFLAGNKFSNKKIKDINEFIKKYGMEKHFKKESVDIEKLATNVYDKRLRESQGLSGKPAINFMRDMYQYYQENMEME